MFGGCWGVLGGCWGAVGGVLGVLEGLGKVAEAGKHMGGWSVRVVRAVMCYHGAV